MSKNPALSAPKSPTNYILVWVGAGLMPVKCACARGANIITTFQFLWCLIKAIS